MDNIKTVIPLNEDELDKYFDDIDKHTFTIDFDRSEYRGKLFLNYIYNSSMYCNLVFTKLDDSVEEIMLEYIKYKRIFSIPTLDDMWSDVLSYLMKEECSNIEYQDFLQKFTNKNKDLVNELVSVLFSLKMHLVHLVVLDNGTIPGVKDKTYKLLGENMVSIQCSPKFWPNMAKIDTMGLPLFNYTNFEEMTFDGRKISYYFLNEYSPFAMLSQFKKERDGQSGGNNKND